jgi:serine/threonine-protein kinase RsbW
VVLGAPGQQGERGGHDHRNSAHFFPLRGEVVQAGRQPVRCLFLTLPAPLIYSANSIWPRSDAVLRMRENQHRAPETVERSLDSTLESVDSAEELVLGIAERAGFDDDDLMKIGMAVRESMVNAVVHGNRYNANKKVRLSVSHGAERLTVRIQDEGEGFEVTELPDPLAPENLMRTSGRGIFLIRSFMDEFDIRRHERGGMEMTLVKYTGSK